MRIKKSYLLILLIFLLTSIFTTNQANAQGHELENLDIHVFINNDGSAVIKEKRVANLTEGTESYIIIDNLGESEISNFKVTENGRQYQFVDSWDIDESQEDKAFKNGIIDTPSGYELSWGIGEYGKHEYLLEYTITNFIKELEDNQMMFWRFQNDKTNTPPKNITVTIESDILFNNEDQKVWGFGFDGNVEFVDGKVFAKSNQPLDSSNYVTILLKLEKGMFLTNDYIDKTFEEVKDQAFAGSSYQDNGSEDRDSDEFSNGPKKLPIIAGVITALFSIIFPLFIVIFIIIVAKSMSKNKAGTFKKRYKEEYYRDYPYEEEILDIYYILYKMGLGNFDNMLTGFLLKWINEDKIIAISEQVGTISKKEKTNIKILNRELPENPLESELFSMLLSASRGDSILQEKEFTKWAANNFSSIASFEKKVTDSSIEKLERLGYLKIVTKKKFFMKFKEYNLTPDGFRLEENIYKYINYLCDYSLLNENEAVNVKIWDRIMIWAGFLGIAEEVEKQFEKLYPQYSVETAYTGNSIYLATALTRNISNARTSASTSSSSGMGGGTSMGGGGGSFGGGSGGGTR